MNLIVYTSIIGGLDRLWSLLPDGISSSTYVAFVDYPKKEFGSWGGNPPRILDGSVRSRTTPKWEQRLVELVGGDSRRTARKYKALPHRFLPEADVWIWVDGNVRLRTQPQEFIRSYLKGDLAIPKHPDRNCAYVEATFCEKHHKDRGEVLNRQVEHYRKEGFPPSWGLAETRVVIRRNTDAIRELNEAWWKELKAGSVRDQVSLPYVCWKLGISWEVIPGRVLGSRHPSIWHAGKHR